MDPAALAQVVKDALEARLLNLWTIAGGTILTYDDAREVADVEVGTLVPMPVDGDESAIAYEVPPVVPEAKVLFQQWGPGQFIKFAPQPGTPCVLLSSVFNDANFIANGKQSEAGDVRTHQLGSSYVLCGFSFGGQENPSVGADTLVLSAGTVKVGDETATAKIPRADIVDHNFNAIMTGLALVLGWVPPTPVPGTPPPVLNILNTYETGSQKGLVK